METVSLDSLTKEEIADEVVRRDKIIVARDEEIENAKQTNVNLATDMRERTQTIIDQQKEIERLTKERNDAYIAIKKALDENEATKILMLRIEEYQQELANERKAVEWAADQGYFNIRMDKNSVIRNELTADEIRQKASGK